MATAAQTVTDILGRLEQIVGSQYLLTDDAEREFYATDVYRSVKLPIAVAQPATVDEMQAIVGACFEFGAPVIVRGGGASYTDGYVHMTDGGITIDVSRMKAIAINEADQIVTVEAGVTWSELWETLKANGLKTAFWGPFSGLNATVCGSMSQNSISHGPGVSAEAALSFDIITGTGEMLSTGTAGNRVANPFFRFFGPDLAGLFTGDCGALGVKARVTLALEKRREDFEAASFNFTSFEAMHTAMRRIAMLQVDEENFGLDAALQQGQIGKSDNVSTKVEMAKSVMKSSGSLAKGAKQLAKMAVAGDKKLMQASYAVHYIVEGHNETEAKAKMDALKAIAIELGEEIPNSVPAVVRGMPFAPFTNVVGPKGERWLPFHGLLPHSSCADFHQALEDYKESQAHILDEHGMFMGRMFMAVGTNAFVYEPTFYWPDEQTIYHERVVPEEHNKALPRYEANEVARSEAKRMKMDIVKIMQDHGAAHFQIGKQYPLLDGRNDASVALIKAVKAALDPKGILNPGALGLSA
ncbi:MAG: FAD-binding oxidoreductase [Pseudomonadota bacterium]